MKSNLAHRLWKRCHFCTFLSGGKAWEFGRDKRRSRSEPEDADKGGAGAARPGWGKQNKKTLIVVKLAAESELTESGF